MTGVFVDGGEISSLSASPGQRVTLLTPADGTRIGPYRYLFVEAEGEVEFKPVGNAATVTWTALAGTYIWVAVNELGAGTTATVYGVE